MIQIFTNILHPYLNHLKDLSFIVICFLFICICLHMLLFQVRMYCVPKKAVSKSVFPIFSPVMLPHSLRIRTILTMSSSISTAGRLRRGTL